jgi:hypothetical protein
LAQDLFCLRSQLFMLLKTLHLAFTSPLALPGALF